MADERMVELQSRFEQAVCMNREFAIELAASKKREDALKVDLAVAREKLADETSRSASLSAAYEKSNKAREAVDKELSALRAELEKSHIANKVIAEQLAGEKTQIAAVVEAAREQSKAEVQAKADETNAGLRAQLEQSAASNRNLAAALAESKRREDALKAEIAAAGQALSESKRREDALLSKARTAESNSQAQTRAAEASLAAQAQADKANAELRAQLEQSVASNRTYAAELAELRKGEAALKSKVVAAEAALAESRKGEAALKAKVVAAEAALAELKRRESDSEAKERETATNLAETSEQLRQALDANAEFDVAYTKVCQKLEGASAGLTASKKREGILQSSVEQYRLELAEAKDAIGELSAKVKTEAEKAAAERKKVETLRAQLRQALEANDEFNRAYEASRKTIDDLSRDLSAARERESALSAKLGKTVQKQKGTLGGIFAGKSTAELSNLERAARQEIAATQLRRSGIVRPRPKGNAIIDIEG